MGAGGCVGPVRRCRICNFRRASYASRGEGAVWVGPTLCCQLRHANFTHVRDEQEGVVLLHEEEKAGWSILIQAAATWDTVGDEERKEVLAVGGGVPPEIAGPTLGHRWQFQFRCCSMDTVASRMSR